MNTFDLIERTYRYYVTTHLDGTARIIEVISDPSIQCAFNMPTEISREPMHTNLTNEYADLLCVMLNDRSVAAYYAGRIDFMQHASVRNEGEYSYMENADSENGAFCIPAY